MGRWQSCFYLCSLGLLNVLGSLVEGINIQVVDSSSNYDAGKVTIKCDGATSNVQLYRRLGSSLDLVQINSASNLVTGFTFVLNRTYEGYYYCSDTNSNSSEIELIAYPFSEPTIARVHTTSIGSILRMPCTIPFGSLAERYSVQWFKGLEAVNTAASPRLTLDGSILVFNTVMAEDYGTGYFCVVDVNSASLNATRQGATISIIIEEPLQLQVGVRSIAIEVGSGAEFSCTATGLPAPIFRWLVKGEQKNTGISTTESVFRNVTIKATSTLSVTGVNAGSAGQVTCVALHQRGGDVVTVVSTANLVVLTNSFQTSLILQEGEVVLRSTLPFSVPGVFTLAVRFYHSESDFEESIVFDPSLADTDDINVKIPREKLPNGFYEFAVRVALKIGNEQGPFTLPLSNRINAGRQTISGQTVSGQTGTSSCDCTTSSPDSSTGISNTIVIAVVMVLIVLMCVAIVVLVVGCVFLYNKKVNLEKAYNISQHSSLVSLPRCASRTSCSSQGSRKSEQHNYKTSPSSVSRSRHGSSLSMDHNEIELGVIQETGEVETSTYENMHKVKEDIKEAPRDVRDFETMDHRAQKQREEYRVNYRANRDQRAGVPTAVREPEPVFPKTHIGAINPNVYRTGHRNRQGRDSGSSFEDLEEDFMEISHKSF